MALLEVDGSSIDKVSIPEDNPLVFVLLGERIDLSEHVSFLSVKNFRTSSIVGLISGSICHILNHQF